VWKYEKLLLSLLVGIIVSFVSLIVWFKIFYKSTLTKDMIGQEVYFELKEESPLRKVILVNFNKTKVEISTKTGIEIYSRLNVLITPIYDPQIER
jgi:hypothetical protein